MSLVSITAVGDDVDAAFALAMERAACTDVISPGDRVLVKPNWNACAIAGSTKLCTVLAACRWARAQGAGEVIVGEGPVVVGRERIDAYLREMGAVEALAKIGVEFVLFDDGGHRLYRDLPDLPPEIGLAEHSLACDVLINVPMLKVHSCCMTTLCVKNLKGCLRPQDKMEFHRIGLLAAVVGLNRLLPSQINLIDAIEAMEGGHNQGNLVPLGVFVAGRDRVATDAVGSALVGMGSGQVPLIRMAGEAGLGEYRLEAIEVVGEPLEPRRFERPQDRLRQSYPDLTIQEAGACSACSAALIDGLFTAGGKRTVNTVALGSQAEPADNALVLGDCLKDYWPTHAHVQGCPPVGAEIAQALIGDDE
ncbi:MAG: DUF362 domain-containing protein [Lentisphaerae bacterium]|mgnify:CR=1 FL=1|jgi:uncharacterized protein (DUF362 family)|nr:DUF362 domain-containing protein [Lentisphaerota bacterium]MBT5606389.1 DUF362 domain-containing protein [Lentisphaerota bacterium]MBT7059759.1 DUF362 domain-containing protein [Lentisphaerota bacterium]MBT7847879.1 DUF362 domain-containing protein [Lentisphaerota bacterium]